MYFQSEASEAAQEEGEAWSCVPGAQGGSKSSKELALRGGREPSFRTSESPAGLGAESGSGPQSSSAPGQGWQRGTEQLSGFPRGLPHLDLSVSGLGILTLKIKEHPFHPVPI